MNTSKSTNETRQTNFLEPVGMSDPVETAESETACLPQGESAGARIGELEEMVLLAVVSLKQEAYGTAIGHRLEAAGRPVSIGTLYVTLDRLKEKELLACRLGEKTAVRGGKPKTFYELTPEGQGALESMERVRAHLRGASEHNDCIDHDDAGESPAITSSFVTVEAEPEVEPVSMPEPAPLPLRPAPVAPQPAAPPAPRPDFLDYYTQR